MIKDIKELNFPDYATLSQATVTINDMGDRTITTQVKIDGNIVPDFSYDWEVEFKGEKYIYPLRKPQGAKDNTSTFAKIDLVFQHWAIYRLKNEYFLELASTDAGTPFADKYVVPLTLNLEGFVIALNKVLAYYFPDGSIYADLNQEWVSSNEPVTIDIDYAYIWDIVQKIYDLYAVRWVIEKDANGNYAIRIGYPAAELTHIFEYGFESGLLKVERQGQDSNIRNKIFGRGGSQNLPYLYFKDYEKYPYGTEGDNQGMHPDPDAIPELRSIYFSELRNSNFRSYIQGWKTNSNRELIGDDALEVYDAERAAEDWAYEKGATDTEFDPVDYVKDDESIAKYGVLPGKIENAEDKFPSLQGMMVEINGVETRADEVVDVQKVTTDEIHDEEGDSTNDINLEAKKSSGHNVAIKGDSTAASETINISSDEFEIPDGYKGTLFEDPSVSKFYIEFKEQRRIVVQQGNQTISDKTSDILNSYVYQESESTFAIIESFDIYDVINGVKLGSYVNIPSGKYRIDYKISFPSHTLRFGQIDRTPLGNNTFGTTFITKYHWMKRVLTTSATIVCKSFNGDVILNKDKSETISVDANSSKTITITGDTFSVPEQGALLVEVPISITPAGIALTEKTVKVANVSTNEVVNAVNIPQGEYKLIVDVKVSNETSKSKTFTVALQPAFIYFTNNTEKWEPTFDIWIKNIFGTKVTDYASETAYVDAVWSPLYTEDDVVVTFSSGNLSGHSNWEFRVKKGGIAYDNSKVITDVNSNEIRSEWRLTLIKSDAELETLKKYVPYKDFNAKAGDHFFFTGILLPHSYTLAAEEEVTDILNDNLAEVKDIKPQWVVSLDKVRAHREDAERLIDSLSAGAVLTIKDKRFTDNVGERQILQSITYTWQEGILLPNIDVVLSDKITTSLSTVAMLQSKVESLSRHVGGMSNLEQIIRKVGDLLYLRKDGFEDISYSPTKFADTVSSDNFRPGGIGGSGWGAYKDNNNKSVIEVDKIFVRDEMHVNSSIVNQIAVLGGKKILSAADITVSSVETVVIDDVVGIKCSFDTKGASKDNLFAVDDIAYSSVFDSDNIEIKYYKRKVIEVGEDYIVLSTTDVDGDGSPQVDDVIVHFGNFTDSARQSFIVIDPLNGGKIEVYAGVNSFDLTDCNKVGLGVNPSTNEAFLYGYGDMFFGDRNLKSDFITYQKRAGETKRSLNINANVTFGPDSTGLSNLSEFNAISDSVAGLQDQIDGVVENWSGEGKPTTTNYPVSEWTTDAEKIAHINDTYVNIEEYVDDETTPDAGKAWRWCDCSALFDVINVEPMKYATWTVVGTIDVSKGYTMVSLAKNEVIINKVAFSFDTQITIWTGPPIYIKVDSQTGEVSLLDTSGYSSGGFDSIRFYHLSEDYVEVTDKDGNVHNLHWHPIADSDAVRALQEVAALGERVTKAEQEISDREYLAETFKNGDTEVVGGVIMSEMVAVREDVDSDIEAFINGGNFAKDDTHGKMILTGGIPDSTESGSTDLEERSKEAATRLFKDGFFVTKSAQIGQFNVTDEFFVFDTGISGILFSKEKFRLLGQGYAGKLFTTNGFGVDFSTGNGQFFFSGESDLSGVDSLPPDPTLLIIHTGATYNANNGNAVAYTGGMVAGLRPRTRIIDSVMTSADPNVLTKYDFSVLVNLTSGTCYIQLPSELLDGQEYYIETKGADIVIMSSRENLYSHKTPEDGLKSSFNVTKRGVFRMKYYQEVDQWTFCWVDSY